MLKSIPPEFSVPSAANCYRWVLCQPAVTVALDAGEAARWMLHCHQMPHLASGMMTEFAIAAN